MSLSNRRTLRTEVKFRISIEKFQPKYVDIKCTTLAVTPTHIHAIPISSNPKRLFQLELKNCEMLCVRSKMARHAGGDTLKRFRIFDYTISKWLKKKRYSSIDGTAPVVFGLKIKHKIIL